MECIQQLTKEHDMMKKKLVATQQHQQEEMRRLASSHKQKIEDMTKAEVQKKQLYKEMKQTKVRCLYPEGSCDGESQS